MKGTVYLVGAGPGPRDLLTLRAARLLEEADVVLHDALVSEDVLSLARNAKRLNVGKRGHRPSTSQHFICRLLVRMGLRHSIVVRLKGGDPGVFGRAMEELDACRDAGIPAVIVPGVSAAFAAAADAGIPLTARGVSRSVALVTPALARGDKDDLHWARAAVAADTAVIYMGLSQAELVAEGLVSFGLPESRPVAVVENAGSSNPTIVRTTLAAIPDVGTAMGDGPKIMIMGDVAAAMEMLAHAAEAA